MSEKREKINSSNVAIVGLFGLMLIAFLWIGSYGTQLNSSLIRETHGEREIETTKDPNVLAVTVNEICYQIEADIIVFKYFGIGIVLIGFSISIIQFRLISKYEWRNTPEGAKERLNEELIKVAGENSKEALYKLLDENKFFPLVLDDAAMSAVKNLRHENLETIVKFGPLDINSIIELDKSLFKNSWGTLLHMAVKLDMYPPDKYLCLIEKFIELGADLTIRDEESKLTAFEIFSQRQGDYRTTEYTSGIRELLKPREEDPNVIKIG